jgi:hypothetical protein
MESVQVAATTTSVLLGLAKEFSASSAQSSATKGNIMHLLIRKNCIWHMPIFKVKNMKILIVKRMNKEKKVLHLSTPLKIQQHTAADSRAALKGLSHEIDFQNFDKNLQNLA